MTTKVPRKERVPGRKPGPAQREEYFRIWDLVDDDGRTMMLFFARTVARDHCLVPRGTPFLMTDRVL
jgi:hypothetical protein